MLTVTSVGILVQAKVDHDAPRAPPAPTSTIQSKLFHAALTVRPTRAKGWRKTASRTSPPLTEAEERAQQRAHAHGHVCGSHINHEAKDVEGKGRGHTLTHRQKNGCDSAQQYAPTDMCQYPIYPKASGQAMPLRLRIGPPATSHVCVHVCPI